VNADVRGTSVFCIANSGWLEANAFRAFALCAGDIFRISGFMRELAAGACASTNPEGMSAAANARETFSSLFLIMIDFV
jgi:hypothetical protein